MKIDGSLWQDRIQNDIQDPRFAVDNVDMLVVAYQNIKENSPDYIDTFIIENYPENIDTANIPSWEDNTVKIIVGKKGQSDVYIVDASAYNDFRDDTVRFLGDIL